ncbi:DNA mismatch repair protein MutS [Wenyingzhuangia sp. 2_MG-2023]|uniref:DNA mismatch repair protein MutS n=1 Tax=Wenyingzhuangia sp. 2_MG-2023 TaxID=3062639 RepID=UPI0026E3D00E|nr:DNA mismatch repair protein MutS [Wenyingzhuangia sp. 2_MG-2023]MDO6738360.1 DNA mismatch repair protein MutS [Wenyingzhuangia sp. 2_MG-2023]MDO6803419.1 DNA mismatch repair protein MutS [Wenyingzhuangia sp. 1_MG-2023]
MKLKIGDKVLVKDTIVRGKVANITKGKIFVLDEDGFELPYDESQLILVNIEQSKLSMYTDINNKMLRQKENLTEVPKRSAKKSKQEKYGVVMEVDLHIERLVKSKSGMSNADILNKQLDTAKHKVEFALKNRIPKIVFIHGVGEGVLKDELYRIFNRYSLRYEEASYQKYGLGATEVSF